MAKETAEKKLLKLIESTQAQEAAVAGQPAPAAPAPAVENEAQKVLHSVQSVGFKLSLPSFLNQIPGVFKGSAVGGGAVAASFGLKDINKVLLVGIVVVACFLVVSFLSGLNQVNKGFTITVESAPANTDQFTPQFKDLQEYITTIARRNIFQPFEPKLAEKETGERVAAVTPINEQTKDLRLVGISWLDTPESASAMIENTQSGVTYFLRSGEKINNITVKEIYADSIVISFGNEEMEMRL